MDLTDPQFHEHALAVHQAQRRAIVTLLAEAVEEEYGPLGNPL